MVLIFFDKNNTILVSNSFARSDAVSKSKKSKKQSHNYLCLIPNALTNKVIILPVNNK